MRLRLRKLSITKAELRSFILTLIATLVGVLIAIFLANSEARKKEKEDTIKLLNTSKLIIINTRDYSQKLNYTIDKLEENTVNEGKFNINDIKENNPIPYPYLLETFMTNEIISKNISEYTHGQLYRGLIDLKKMAKYETSEIYEQSLNELILLIDLEIQFQKGELDKGEIKNQMKNESEKLKAK